MACLFPFVMRGMSVRPVLFYKLLSKTERRVRNFYPSLAQRKASSFFGKHFLAVRGIPWASTNLSSGFPSGIEGYFTNTLFTYRTQIHILRCHFYLALTRCLSLTSDGCLPSNWAELKNTTMETLRSSCIFSYILLSTCTSKADFKISNPDQMQEACPKR